MGFVRSLKKIFKNGKKENRLSDIENARMESEHRITKKSKPVSRQKSMRTGIYEPYRNHFPLKQSQVPACQQPTPRLPYGAYDPTKAKLITAGGEINMENGPGEKLISRPMNQSAKIAAMQNSNYEMFDWRQSNQSLNQYNPNGSLCYEPVQNQFNRNGPQYGSNRSVLSVGGGAVVQNRNGPMRGSTRSFSAINFGMNPNQQFMGSQQSLNMYQQSQFQQQQQYNRANYEFHQAKANQAAAAKQQRDQRINQLSGRCGTGSVTSIHSLQSCSATERPSRPSSVQMMPTGPYQDWSVNNKRQGPLTSSSMSSLNALAPQLNQLQSVVQNAVQMNSANPNELADAMRKMEECLQVFAQISGAKNQQNPQSNQVPPTRTDQSRANNVISPTNQNRSQNLLQPQPEFQKREQMKKRRQRRKSDISKMDLTELRRKLESIDVDSDTTENSSDQGEKQKNKNRKNSTSTDAGFYDGSGSDSGASARQTGSPASSGDNLSGYMSTGSNSSDSGVVTPPIQKVKNMPEGSVKDSKKKMRSILKTNNQISFQI